MIKKILAKVLPSSEKVFFTYFEENANLCHQIAEIFMQITQDGFSDEKLRAAIDLKHQSAHLTKKTLVRLHKTFMTPIEPEDIQTINSMLNKVTRIVAKTIAMMKIDQLPKITGSLKKQASTLLNATSELKIAIAKFRHFKKVDALSESSHRMKMIETHGDEILSEALTHLYASDKDFLTIIKLIEIYKSIEKALDLCFTVSDTLVNVALKHT